MEETVKAKSPDVQALKQNEKKWSPTLMKAGWSAFPNIIIEKQRALGLDAMDMNILLHLVQYWWLEENVPHPSVATIAEAIGVTPRAIQKRITGLQAAGLITREERRHGKFGSQTNLYRFDGLIKACLPFAQEKLEAAKKKSEENKDRVKRKKPKLVVNNDAQGI
ncbi:MULTISPECIES: helix-turn-helix domain-containing protein [Rhizobium/Agrobacterium group]|uniref:helix-turn-helix domain-containing protein n=1 Tax=Rhizobium/Agrobacterium group TaxID=227290 RepID=UPI00157364F5|nr:MULTISPECIES: helix-turn-helix domain-containing protein [Rhizobium/Agrobacterium group]NSZ66792.1 MarR family transcriptional regulator [Agrobacterium tumefaciens]NTA19673.1 MarR family transcriptional regulator [Agrobacterium tumefaciens]NTA73241.1 MarR family transcriptional regulator [Agrobacterium tumefaciens]NTJ11912.1 MarR family transcriptional regulator [Rhizobium lusitanum]WCK75002.1 helix-turn-helix domain-containing protein [Agrobacterium tumefaciens]